LFAFLRTGVRTRPEPARRRAGLLALLAALGSGLSPAALAQTYGGAAGYVAQPLAAGPAQVLTRGIDRLTGFLIGVGEPTPEATLKFLEAEIAPHFDFAYMSAWAAGPYHHRLDAEQRARFAERLKTLFLGALARNLGSFSRPLPRIDVYRPRPGRSSRETVVPARVIFASGFAARLEFRFYWSGTAWRIFDVAANGASAVAYYRRYFRDALERLGTESLGE
jgi:phospholipid transport system substrate-binding protein